MPFGFQRRKADVLSHWFVVIDGFEYSTSEFYAELEAELSARRVPGLTHTRVEFAEGGMLSDKRVYLRMLRERLVFDVCAAPFGRAYFFSLRFAEIPIEIPLWQLLLCVFGLGVSLALLVKIAGVLLGLLLFSTVVVSFCWMMRNAIGLGLQDLDATLIKSPIVGPVYERFLRKESYYRHDTRLIYHTIVSEVVKKKVEEVTAAKGVKLIETHDYSPILGELYKSSKVQLASQPLAAAV